MAGFSYYDPDWPEGRAPSRRRPPEPSLVYSSRTRISRERATDPAAVDRVRSGMMTEVQAYADRCGYHILGTTWATDPPTDPTADLWIRVEASLTQRTDGEWPAIHLAIREDQNDREAAQRTAVDRELMKPVGKRVDDLKPVGRRIDERLDALAAAADIWSDRALRPSAPV